MSFLNKIMFWKKEDDFDFDNKFDDLTKDHMDPSNDFMKQSLDDNQKQNLGLEEQSPFDELQQQQHQKSAFSASQPTQPLQQPAPGGKEREMELINSKLDTIKALLSSLDQRIANIEKSNGGRKEKLW
jgi:hypothetical protein